MADVIEIENLNKEFATDAGAVHILRDVSLVVARGIRCGRQRPGTQQRDRRDPRDGRGPSRPRQVSGRKRVSRLRVIDLHVN